jgi:hypothetical protein
MLFRVRIDVVGRLQCALDAVLLQCCRIVNNGLLLEETRKLGLLTWNDCMNRQVSEAEVTRRDRLERVGLMSRLRTRVIDWR